MSKKRRKLYHFVDLVMSVFVFHARFLISFRVSFFTLFCVQPICSSRMIWCEYESLMVLTLSPPPPHPHSNFPTHFLSFASCASRTHSRILLSFFLFLNVVFTLAVSVSTEYVNDSMVFHFLSLIIYPSATRIYILSVCFALLSACVKRKRSRKKKLKR